MDFKAEQRVGSTGSRLGEVVYSSGVLQREGLGRAGGEANDLGSKSESDPLACASALLHGALQALIQLLFNSTFSTALLFFFFIRFSSRVMFVWFSDTCWMSHPQGWSSSQAHLAGEKGGSPVGTHSVHAWTSSPGSVQHWEPPPFCSLAPGLTCLSHSGVS